MMTKFWRMYMTSVENKLTSNLTWHPKRGRGAVRQVMCLTFHFGDTSTFWKFLLNGFIRCAWIY